MPECWGSLAKWSTSYPVAILTYDNQQLKFYMKANITCMLNYCLEWDK